MSSGTVDRSGCIIRSAQNADAAVVSEIYAPFVRDSFVSFEEEPPGAAEMARRINSATCWLVLESSGEVQGYAYAVPFRTRHAYQWSVEVSVYVRAAFHGRGAGRSLYMALFSCLRLMGYHRALAGITLPNPASVAIHERLGFEKVGVFEQVGYKLGAWRDVGWWNLKLVDTPSAPVPPRKWTDVCDTSAVRDALALAATPT